MSKKLIRRTRHTPQRTCVGCREVLPKRQLIRIVRAAESVTVDASGRLAGRGAYLHDRRSCWERGLQGALAHALKTKLTEDDRARLEEFMKTFPLDAEAGGTT
ncbi:MAG: YlxR family protein [Anaerolineaceae bacterium]|nr:YlxR family protein [Anaerolineaceae bacterium]OQY88235.1 MAG: hypothetical protein B6D38_10515 [Anaerolineae bacterium UTCFX1]